MPTTSLGQPTVSGIFFFLLFVAVSLLITYWASRRTRTAVDYYAAARSISAAQNGLALAGDYLSAASFLGIAGLVALKGIDGMIYAIGFLVGWPVLLYLVAEPLRNLGKFTFADVLAYRLQNRPIRIAAGIGAILTVLAYTTAQMVGAGNLVKLMFGIPYEVSIFIVGIVMLIYVLFGGMIATTWVQIVKAVLLLIGVTLLVILGMGKFDFSVTKLMAEVGSKYGKGMLEPGTVNTNIWEAVSLGLGLMFGPLGLPHILMRFYTVPNAKEARKSLLWATWWIAYFYCLIPLGGLLAAALVGKEIITHIDKGGNMAAPLLAELLGGTPFLGFLAAVAFATILAVVAGLTLAGASALSHDIYVNVVKGGRATEAEQVRVARVATLIMGLVAIFLGIIFKGQNVAFMVGLAFAIACSANFPALFLSIVWRRLSTVGATAAIVVGALTAAILIFLSPTVWVDVLKHSAPIFPLKNPALVSMPIGFVVAILGSLLCPDKEAQDKFEAQKVRSYLAVGAE
ncbi:SSS sodium solute transporter superfamily [Ammonifex degensii KC4]|uniref:SSS sodium solute transporter superfamily n=1 Tax=Ammonifex degensii (strain DSM 10501 / KC4) TaxID=429009 RepID=C9R9F5_AMMDK|nr:sodium/solute symporter [Ammonifex degensii]ACX52934.1 SSS sodium solute transporter superfamily [Ammonifex degensii KC4]